MKIKLFFASIILIALYSCTTVLEKKSANAENFDDFIKRFKTDSVFRYERIIFPLKGYLTDDEYVPKSDIDTGTIEYFWDEIEINTYLTWELIGDEFIRTIEKSDTLVIDETYIPGSGFDVEARYILKDNKWFLNFFFWMIE